MYEMLIFWLVMLILCIGIEVLTLGLTTIWFAGGALAAIFANLLHAPIFVQIILFFVVSLVLLFFTRPIAVKYFNKDRVKTNVESMVGRQAIVTGEIDNVKATGQVTVNGQEWTARSWEDRVTIPEGAVVTVRAINGVKLIVEAARQPEASEGTVTMNAEEVAGRRAADIREADMAEPETEPEASKAEDKSPENPEVESVSPEKSEVPEI